MNYIDYFKQKGLIRFINKLKDKYYSKGKITGMIKLDNISSLEAECLSNLFGQMYYPNTDITLSVSKFLKIMENSKFENFDIYYLIENYFGKLITKKEEKIKEINLETNFYQEIFNRYSKFNYILDIINEKKYPYAIIHQRYIKDKNKLKKDLSLILNCLNNLPKDKKTLSIFSSNYTSDPHFLDIDTNNSNLFLILLCLINNINMPITREEKIKLLNKFNLKIDTISNFVITYNLISDKISNFNNQPLILNIENILNINKINGLNNKIFIFENPSILNYIIDKQIRCSVIITSGMPNMALYLLLDKLKDELYYNGDFDPEGLIISKILKEKYNVELFCYNKSDYDNCISNNIINSKRINKLNNINIKELDYIKNLMLFNKKNGYQENNIKNIIKYIEKNH